MRSTRIIYSLKLVSEMLRNAIVSQNNHKIIVYQLVFGIIVIIFFKNYRMFTEFTKPWPKQCPSYTEYVGTDFFTALEIVKNTKPVYSQAETMFLIPCCRYNVLVFAQGGLGNEYGCPTTSGTNLCPRLPKFPLKKMGTYLLPFRDNIQYFSIIHMSCINS